jgi:hypothetical protein
LESGKSPSPTGENGEPTPWAGAWGEDRRCSGSVHLRRADGRWRISRSALALDLDD